MAWPCISRVCCLARFWNQFDKSDLSVPLTIQNYSDITEQEVRSVTKQVTDRNPRNNYSTADHRELPQAPGEGPGTQGSFRGRKEPSYKPREDYKPPGVPFQSVTQYKQDFKPWPIPRKENFPWISNEGSRAESGTDSPVNTYNNASLVRGEREVRGRGPGWGEQQGTAITKTSTNRQEYRPWTGAKPAKSTRTAPYISPEAEANHLHPETSYQAAYSGEAHRSSGTGDHTPSAPAPVMQPSTALQSIPTPLQASSLQKISLPERNSVCTNKAEDHLEKTKFPPNPSAVFQGGSRVFNI